MKIRDLAHEDKLKLMNTAPVWMYRYCSNWMVRNKTDWTSEEIVLYMNSLIPRGLSEDQKKAIGDSQVPTFILRLLEEN